MDAATIVQLIISGLAVGAVYALVAEGFYIAFRSQPPLTWTGRFSDAGMFYFAFLIHMGLPFYVILLLLVCAMAILESS
jgi:ABC-type uncharacterized transport system permease subunit